MNIRYIGGKTQGGTTATTAAATASREGKAPEAIEDEGRLLVFKRYCHLYRQWELEGLLERLRPTYEFEMMRRGFDKGNWFVTLVKTHDRTLAKDGD